MFKRSAAAIAAAVLLSLATVTPSQAALGPRGLNTRHPFAHFHGTCAHWWVTFGLGRKAKEAVPDGQPHRFRVVRYWYRDRMPVSQVMHPGDVDTYADVFRHGKGKAAFVEVWMDDSWVKSHEFDC